MAMSVAVFRRETRHDEIGSKFSDHPHDVRENLFPIPDAQGFLRRFGKTEVVRAGEELPAVIDPPRGEQLLRANNAELVAQFRPDQILAAVAASERKIGGVVERAVCPIGNQARVLIVRMRRDVEDATEHVQLLEREANLRRIHRLRRLGGAADRRETNERKQSRHETTRDRKHGRGRYALRPAGLFDR